LKCHIKLVGKLAKMQPCHLKLHFKKKRVKIERCRPVVTTLSGVSVWKMTGEKRSKMLGESDTERKLHDT
jgi:hypothetical protein